jgi:hypothetical protein
MLTWLLCGCSSHLIQNHDYENMNTERKMVIVLIEGSGSMFKEALIDSLVATYRSGYDVQVLNVRDARSVAGLEYDVLIIMDRLKAWMSLNNNLKGIMKTADPNRTVVFLSTGGTNWHWPHSKFTAVTAATKKVKVAEVFPKLHQAIESKTVKP